MVVPPFHTPKWSFLVGNPHGCWGKPSILGNPHIPAMVFLLTEFTFHTLTEFSRTPTCNKCLALSWSVLSRVTRWFHSNSNIFKHVLHVSPPKNWGRWTQIDDHMFSRIRMALGEKKQPTPNGKVTMMTRKSWNGEKRPKRSKPWSPFSKQFMDILKLLRFSFKLLWHCINYCTPRRVEKKLKNWDVLKVIYVWKAWVSLLMSNDLINVDEPFRYFICFIYFVVQ